MDQLMERERIVDLESCSKRERFSVLGFGLDSSSRGSPVRSSQADLES